MKPNILCTNNQTPEFTRQHLVPNRNIAVLQLVLNVSASLPFSIFIFFLANSKKCISHSFLRNSLAADLSEADNTNVHLYDFFFSGKNKVVWMKCFSISCHTVCPRWRRMRCEAAEGSFCQCIQMSWLTTSVFVCVFVTRLTFTWNSIWKWDHRKCWPWRIQPSPLIQLISSNSFYCSKPFGCTFLHYAENPCAEWKQTVIT